MTRLRALLAAMPDILAAVEHITAADLRYRAFDRLAQAAIDEAATVPATEPLPMGAAGQVLVADPGASQGVSWRTPDQQAGTVYGNSVGRAVGGVDTATFNVVVNPDAMPADLGAGHVVTPMVVDLDGGQRLTGTFEGNYTGDGVSGTFTPDAATRGFDLHDAIGLNAEGLAQVRLETGAGSEPLRPATVNPPSDLPTWAEVNRQHRQ